MLKQRKYLCALMAVFAALMLFVQTGLASQADPNEGANLSGLTFRQNLNNASQALLSLESGTSRPSFAIAGTIWLNTTTTPWKLEEFDGTNDITLGEVNSSTHTFQVYNGTALGRLQLYTADTGAANAYVLTPTPALAAYATGQIFTLKPAHANTGASTLNDSSLGAKSIKLMDGTDPAANAMVTTGTYFLVYDGTNMELLNPSAGGSITAIANGGTANSTAAGARGSTGLDIDEETTHGDSAYSILSTDRTVATSGALTASRTWTLPAANAVNAGQKTCIVDQAGGVTNTNTLVIARAGSDTIDGGTTYTLNGAYQGICLISDGSSKWSSRKIPDAALPSLSASQLLGKGTSGGVGPITLGTGLTMTGSTMSATSGGGPGTYTSICSTSPSGVATSDCTGISGSVYRDLVITYSGLSSNTATRTLEVQVSVAATFSQTFATYFGPAGASGNSPAYVKSSTQLCDSTATQGAANTFSGYIVIYDYANTTAYKHYTAYVTDNALSTDIWTCEGTLATTSAIDGVRFYWNGTGNFDAGSYTVYGRN